MISADKGSNARITSASDKLLDKESCSFALMSGDTLFCVVDKEDWGRVAYEDGEFTSSRFFHFTPMCFSEEAAREFIQKSGMSFFRKYDHDQVTVHPIIVTLQQAAAARLALYESDSHEWGE